MKVMIALEIDDAYTAEDIFEAVSSALDVQSIRVTTPEESVSL